MKKSKRLLVANRGEIAVRVIRAARELGLETVAVTTPDERGAMHAELADHVIELEGGGLARTYLSAQRMVEAAREAGADALHPGYGFISEDAAFARACEGAGITFVGPPPACLEASGDKLRAKELVARAGVPTLAFHSGPPGSFEKAARRIGFPVLVKASSGGGGRGIRRVDDPRSLADLAAQASREAAAAFGSGGVYLERLLERARHVEVQVLGDASGDVVALGERECSIQRRHQKLIEESPAPCLEGPLRLEIAEAAVRAARAVGYRNAGTVEFLLEVDASLEPVAFHFLEVNARIQVEHPVTEAVLGVDLVAWQLRIAAGEKLAPELHGLEPRGHAIECRLCAESPPTFSPSAGRVAAFRPPLAPGLRFDTGYREGDAVSTAFDSLLGKLIAWGPDRPSALRRALLGLESSVVLGVETNVDFLADLLRLPDVARGRFTTQLIASAMSDWRAGSPPPEAIEVARAAAARGAPVRSTATGARIPGPWDVLSRSSAP